MSDPSSDLSAGTVESPSVDEPASERTPRVIIYLWCLIPLGILGAGITLGLMLWIYQNVQTANRQAEQLDREILSGMSSITIIVENLESDFHAIFESNSDRVTSKSDPIELLNVEIEKLQELVRETAGTEFRSGYSDGTKLSELRIESLEWRDRNRRLESRREQAWGEAVDAMETLRAQMESLHGQRRIKSIQLANKLKSGASADVQGMIDAFLGESRSGSVVSASKTELSDLAVLCDQLGRETEIDILSSVLLNEITPRLTRLSENIKTFGDPSLQEGVARVRDAIVGTALPGSGGPAGAGPEGIGLYLATEAHLKSIEEGRRLHEYVDSGLTVLDGEIAEQVASAKSVRSVVSDVAAGSLRMGVLTVLLAGGLIGAIYAVLVYKIAMSVQRFVKDINQSHNALEVVNREALSAYNELRQTMNEKDQLQDQLVEAQKLESIGQLAAGIAHEINTPAQYVGDNTRFLQSEFKGILKVLDRYAEQLDTQGEKLSWEERSQIIRETLKEVDYEFIREEIPQAITQSLDGVERITSIVKAMKEFSHPGSDTKEPSDINDAILSTSMVCSNRWKYAADIDFDLDESIGPVPCFLAEFNQVMLNLIVNAADAIESFNKGTDRKGMIVISTERDDDTVRVRVQDNGGGIPEDIRAKIFDPFFTTKEVGKGTGQGLSISRDVIVNKHGGSLICETQVGVGTTFVIELPLHQFGGNADPALEDAA